MTTANTSPKALVSSGDAAVWPWPDDRERALWRAHRALIERGSAFSTPNGWIPRQRRTALRYLLDGVRRGLFGVDLFRGLMRSALKIQRTEINLMFEDLPKGFDGYRILQVSDPHLDALPGLADAIVATCEPVSVDLCVLTGDFRARESGPFVEHDVIDGISRIVGATTARDGALAILGNHDSYEMVGPLEQIPGLRVLTNEIVEIKRAADRMSVVGFDDVHRFYSESTERALRRYAQREGFRIGLVHSPEFVEQAVQLGCSLYLCGHTHGGQICLPGGRPIATGLHRGRDLVSGLWRSGSMTGYTSSGAGVSKMLPIRICSRSEITIFTLRCREHRD